MAAPSSCLLVFGGLPGTGKTTISRLVAAHLKAMWLRIDAIEQATDVATASPVGYAVANAVAAANLALGFATIVIDGVHPVAQSRQAWRDLARLNEAKLIEVEIACSDPAEHRRQIEQRQPDLPGHRLPSWNSVLEQQYEPWEGPHLIIDTAAFSKEDAVSMVLKEFTYIDPTGKAHDRR